ncbi:sigma-70 family RNA polymerase sigma factor [Clostridium frigidicarnis]|uniref:RNA polymerase sigma-70 factor, ECF subfamily n=1 Tax=Clostridium frigidicarnis TaxID=84698 RepID=A0A1I1A285_9CLOT|nr:sigma-70 family RNA polymerase sigma factor [Clostridium frigidicarnis]SFB30513.1 RNA polymerase sigma-70 factor, ECF subfamily [Clostridium frigidicarnis]
MELSIEQSLNKDKEAFIEAINSCTPTLYKIGKNMVENDEDIGDAIQDTILTAYEKVNTLKDSKYFNTWVVRIFINKCNCILNKRKPNIALDDAYNIGCKDGSIKDLELKEAINKLKKDYKLVIILYYIMGFSIKEICSILNEKEGTIKSRLCRARNDLRDFYGVNKEDN